MLNTFFHSFDELPRLLAESAVRKEPQKKKAGRKTKKRKRMAESKSVKFWNTFPATLIISSKKSAKTVYIDVPKGQGEIKALPRNFPCRIIWNKSWGESFCWDSSEASEILSRSGARLADVAEVPDNRKKLARFVNKVSTCAVYVLD
jgi:hypothetical protein